MLLKREEIESREIEYLASYAVKSSESRGREFEEAEDPFRTSFQRDRDRVIHSKAFRRLNGKTQVFVAHHGDHYRSRLTHTMEVAQLSRDLARMLGLNEDLAETIALAHDLGHTPFGHAGQDALHAMMCEYGGCFEHNEQSRRTVERLEKKNSDYPGLNLTFEVRDGLIKHRTSYDKPVIRDTLMPSLEAQVVNLADEIAYQNHDVDDGLRAGIIKSDDLNKVNIWKSADGNVSNMIKLMVNDLAKNTDKLVNEYDIKSVDDIYKTNETLCRFSDDFYKDCDELKKFLYQKFYLSHEVSEVNKERHGVIRFLFKKMMDDNSLLPESVRFNSDDEMYILVKDYIAGMTDGFALDLYKKLS